LSEPPYSGVLPADCWQQIFGNQRPVAVEIGPGRGEFLVASAQRTPAHNFFAIEHSAARTREVAARLARAGVDNARVICGDASCLIELLPDACVDAFHVLFPDPWWKRRHHKRRLWTPRFVAALRRALVVAGTVELITDVGDYFAVAQAELNADPELEVISVGHPAAVATSFARKAVQRGDLLYRSVHRRRTPRAVAAPHVRAADRGPAAAPLSR
jgi:tRNA (guanine-N7-)-methyltransferase